MAQFGFVLFTITDKWTQEIFNIMDYSMACGVDFGTTNSSVALADSNEVRVLALDPHKPQLDM